MRLASSGSEAARASRARSRRTSLSASFASLAKWKWSKVISALGRFLADRLLVGLRHVHGHDLDGNPDFARQAAEEGGKRLAALSFADPDHMTSVVIRHNGQIAMALAEADLVDADSPQLAQSAGIEKLLYESVGDVADGPPRDVEQQAHGRLVGSLDQQSYSVLERSSEVAVVSRPWHRLSHWTLAAPRLETGDWTAGVDSATPDPKLTPSPNTSAVLRRGRPLFPALWASQPPVTRPKTEEQMVTIEAEGRDPRALEA